jgi:hypothetical protein
MARIPRIGWLPPLAAFAVFVADARKYSRASLYFVDDPFISMRYAANLVTRGELSFNPGVRVEGYSNFLHVVVHALTFWAHGRVPDAATAIDDAAGLVLAATLAEAALLGVLARSARHGRDEGTAWYCAWVLTMASWPFAFWASAGMETPLEGLLYAAIAYAATRLARGSEARALIAIGALLVAVTLLRFEGVVVALAVTAALGAHLVWTGRARAAAAFAVPVASVAGAYHAWRIGYFGALLPNTFVAKATGGSLPGRLLAGTSYCAAWVAFLGGGLGLVLAALAVAGAYRSTRDAARRLAANPVTLVAAVLVATKVALVVWGGGDWMPGWRMLLPVTPIALFLGARAVLALVERPGRPIGLTSTPAALVLGLAVVACGRGIPETFVARTTLPDEDGNRKKLPHDYLLAGAVLERSFGGSPEEVAIGEAGLVPFEARDVRFMDLFGLVDRDMARQPGAMHHKVHVGHVLERAPGAVLFSHLNLEPPYGPFQYGAELLGSPAFHAAYRQVDSGAGLEAFGWALYMRRDIDPHAHGLAWAAAD